MIHESSLLLLLKAPKKKYLKKMLDYAVAVSYNSSGCLEDMDTPIGNSFGSDLEITAV